MSPPTQDDPARPASPGAVAWLAASSLLIALALSASAALLVDYLRPAPLFCDAGSGCAALRHSALAFVGRLPLPAVGVAGLCAIAVSTLLRGARARTANAALAAVAAAVAAALIITQLQLGVFCKYCMVVDASCLGLAALAYVRRRHAFDRPPRAAFAVGPAAAFLVAAVAPAVVAIGTPVAVPPDVAAELAATPPGQVCVVEYVDYECPHCRKTHADFAPIIAESAGRLRVVRKNVPLVTMHPHAMTAARAAACGAAMGKAEAMSAGLFATPVDALTEAGCAALAGQIGLDAAQYRACMDDPQNSRRVDAEREAFRAQGGRGLPTVWIDRTRIEGARGAEALRSAVADALSAHAQAGAARNP